MDAFALKLQSRSLKGSERHGCLLQYFSETAKTKAAAVWQVSGGLSDIVRRGSQLSNQYNIEGMSFVKSEDRYKK
jgi:hypothetical protein